MSSSSTVSRLGGGQPAAVTHLQKCWNVEAVALLNIRHRTHLPAKILRSVAVGAGRCNTNNVRSSRRYT